MSPSENPQAKATKADRRAEARVRAEQMRLEAERRSRRQRTSVVALTALLVVALVVGVGIVVQRSRSQAAQDAAGPAGLSDRGGVVLGEDDAPVTVTTYLDFMCPACEQFESENAALLDELREKGTIEVEYVPIAILDRFSSGTRYSTRSAGAAYCVAESDPELLPQLVSALYENQPEEGGTGLPQEQLVQIAQVVGVSDAGQECITDGTYEGYAANVTDQASRDGVQGTPTVLVDGTTLGDLSKQGLVDMINASN